MSLTQNARVFLLCLLFTGNVVCAGTWVWAFMHYPITLMEPDPVMWTVEVVTFILTIIGDVYVFLNYLMKQTNYAEVMLNAD